MRFFEIVAVFTTATGLTAANPLPEDSMFSGLSDLSSNFFNLDSATAVDPLGDSTTGLLKGDSAADYLEGASPFLESVNFATIDDGSDDFDRSFFPTDDFSIADGGDFCHSSAPIGPVRKRDNTHPTCDSSASPQDSSSSINLQLPNLLNMEGSLEGSLEEFTKILTDADFAIEKRPDDGQCLEPPYLTNLCCDGPPLRPVPGIWDTVYAQINDCFYSKLHIWICFSLNYHSVKSLTKVILYNDRDNKLAGLPDPFPCLLSRRTGKSSLGQILIEPETTFYRQSLLT